jgi:hypothetical protein
MTTADHNNSPKERPDVLPSPLPGEDARLPAHLGHLADRARGDVEAASSVNTRKAYTRDETWIKFAKLSHGPLFRRVTGQGKLVGAERLNDKEIARLVKRVAMAAGVRGDLSEEERVLKFSGHSLRAGLASSAEVDERYVQKQLGHASAEMTRRYQRRRDRFRINLTKAAGLQRWICYQKSANLISKSIAHHKPISAGQVTTAI